MPALDQAVVGTAATGQGIEKRTGTVGTTGTIGTAGIVGTAVGDQHGLSSAARLCSRAFFQAGSYAQQRMRRHRREAANPTKTLHVNSFVRLKPKTLQVLIHQAAWIAWITRIIGQIGTPPRRPNRKR